MKQEKYYLVDDGVEHEISEEEYFKISPIVMVSKDEAIEAMRKEIGLKVKTKRNLKKKKTTVNEKAMPAAILKLRDEWATLSTLVKAEMAKQAIAKKKKK